ncbi:MAG: LysR family transcriptional regulator [Candidatus Korobacteraceae bacterium]
MDRLNYHHLLYFFTVAHEGSVARASKRLGLAQPTISAQIHALESELGRKLLERSGRGLKVTPAGETVLRYAGSIFALGGELLTALRANADAAPVLSAGVSSSLPPSLAAALLQGVLAQNPKPRLTVVEASPEALSAKLAARALHFALTDAPPANAAARGLHSRVLLESPIALFAPEPLARRVRKDFPACLPGVPVLMPSNGALRLEVERWLALRQNPLQTVAEMPHPETYALAAGAAVFAPSLLHKSLRTAHGLLPAGELEGTRWRTFLITAGKSLKLPGLDAVIAAARDLQ